MNVFLIAATTADGLIAQDSSQNSTRWTSKEDTKFFMERTKKAGAMVMGSTTFETIGGPMAGRKIYVYTYKPEDYQDFHSSQVEPVSMPPEELIEKAESDGFKELAICGGSSIYTQFMQARVVDKLYLTRESLVFGQGVPLFNAPLEVDLKLKKVHKLSKQTIVMEYEVVRGDLE